MDTLLKANLATVADVAKRFHVTPGRVRQLVLDGSVTASRLGGKLLLIDISSATQYFSRRKIGRPKNAKIKRRTAISKKS